MPQVPTGNIQKSVKFAAAYTSSTFNKKNDAFYRMSGVLDGMQLFLVGGGNIQVTPGAFIQQGIIVDLTADFLVPVPGGPLPWTIYAVTDDEVGNSPTNIAAVTSGLEPPGVVIIGTTADGVNFVLPRQISIKGLRRDMDSVLDQAKVRTQLLCNAGFELVNPDLVAPFTFPGQVMDGWRADNLSDKAPNSKVELITDPLQTLQGGVAVKLTSQSYNDPGGVNPDASIRPAAVRSNARIWQALEGYRELVGQKLTIAVSLRLPTGSPGQLHDLELAIYGSSIGTPGFSDTPVDKVSVIIPTATLTTTAWKKFFITAVITNLNTGVASPAYPAFPGISFRVGYVNTEPAGFPITQDSVLIDDAMVYQGDIEDPAFFTRVRAVDWLHAEESFEAQTYELCQLGQSTDLEYRLGGRYSFRTRKARVPTIGYSAPVVNEDGAALSVNNQAAYGKLFVADEVGGYKGVVSKLIGGFRPARLNAKMRAQA